MMDSGCDVHFTKNRCWISKDDGKELDMIRSGGVFFVAARLSKSSSKEANTLELNPMTAAEVEQAALAREHAAFGTPGPAAGATLDGHLCPRDSSEWHLASTPPSRAPHRQQKHRSGQQTRLSKLAFLSPQTVSGCWRAPNWSTPCRISWTRLFSSSACLALDSFDRRRLRGWAAESRIVSGKPDACMCKAA